MSEHPRPEWPQPGDDPTHTSDPSGSGAPTPSSERTWGTFQLLEALGHGGFGRVYRAWEATLAREVALKIIRVPDPAEASTILHEGRLLARVRHPNVVTVHGAQQVGDEIGIWMELIRGRSLADLVRQQGPMSADEAAVVGMHICRALAAVHNAGLLHRDIKAQNVMRESGGRIVLMDFGAGREVADHDISGRAELPGTPRYMAPELFAGASASQASDIYSLGVLLFFLVTGGFPVDGRSLMDIALAHSDRRRRSLADARPDLPPAFVRVVERSLASTPSDRYRTAGAMVQALTEAMPDPEDRTRPSIQPAPLPLVPPVADRAQVMSSVARWTLILIGGVVGIGFFGFVTTAQFNDWFDIGNEFVNNSPITWWMTGLRSLIPVMVYTAAIIIIVRVVMAMWHVIERFLPSAVRLKIRGRDSVSGVLRRLGGPEARSAGHELLLLQAAMILFAIWVFYDIYWALIAVDANTADDATLRRVRPYDNVRIWYRPAITAILLAMISAWIAVWRRQRARGLQIERTTLWAGISMIAVVVMMLEMPYALMFRPVDRVELIEDGKPLRCYQVGSNGSQWLLYCPDTPAPRTRVRSEGEFQRTGDTESVFSLR